MGDESTAQGGTPPTRTPRKTAKATEAASGSGAAPSKKAARKATPPSAAAPTSRPAARAARDPNPAARSVPSQSPAGQQAARAPHRPPPPPALFQAPVLPNREAVAEPPTRVRPERPSVPARFEAAPRLETAEKTALAPGPIRPADVDQTTTASQDPPPRQRTSTAPPAKKATAPARDKPARKSTPAPSEPAPPRLATEPPTEHAAAKPPPAPVEPPAKKATTAPAAEPPSKEPPAKKATPQPPAEPPGEEPPAKKAATKPPPAPPVREPAGKNAGPEPPSKEPATKKAAAKRAPAARKATPAPIAELVPVPAVLARPTPVPRPARDAADLWAHLKNRPEYAPTLLAEEAVARYGPEARSWAYGVRDAYPGAPATGLARLAEERFTRLARGTGTAAALTGPVGWLAGGAFLAMLQARLVLHVAAAYEVDPTAPERVEDLLDLLAVREPRRPLLRWAGVWAGGRLAARLVPGAGVVLSTYGSGVTMRQLAGRSATRFRANGR